MKAFTINAEGNITAFASREAGEANLPPAGAFVFTSAAGLQSYLKQFPTAAAVEIWNSITGVRPVRKFTDRATAVTRIWSAIQSLEPAAPPTAHVAPEEASAKKNASRAKRSPTVATKAKGSREGTKTETILGLLTQKRGSTLKAIMRATEWQAHSVRGFISAVVTKKMGLTVVSTRSGDGERNYSVQA